MVSPGTSRRSRSRRASRRTSVIRTRVGVCPRGCGETPSARAPAGWIWGLSPRVRGNHRRYPCPAPGDESIPAGAGKPRCRNASSTAPLRLSPRVRGSLYSHLPPPCWVGSIPASPWACPKLLKKGGLRAAVFPGSHSVPHPFSVGGCVPTAKAAPSASLIAACAAVPAGRLPRRFARSTTGRLWLPDTRSTRRAPPGSGGACSAVVRCRLARYDRLVS